MHPWALGVLIVENGYHRGPLQKAYLEAADIADGRVFNKISRI